MNCCFLWAILEKSACPTHTLRRLWSFWSTYNFFQILLVGVALGKAPILIQVLAKQTEFALVRPIPMSSYLSSQLKYMIFRNMIICIPHHLRTYEPTMWLIPSWLKSSVGRALHLVSQRSWVRIPFRPEFFSRLNFAAAFAPEYFQRLQTSHRRTPYDFI